jgi:carbohydrate kinase (thermoresistant glucokinase family)
MTDNTFIVVMGVSGAGKTEIASGLARELDCPWLEADELHSPENIARMRSGHGLSDEARWPWLASVCDEAVALSQRPAVIACSALKRRYRDFIRERLGQVHFIFLDGAAEIIAARLANRKGHYAGVSLLDSQLEALEPPEPDEQALHLSIGLMPADIIRAAVKSLTQLRAIKT